MDNVFVSFVVDRNPNHYYQAELLLFSLENFAKHPKDHIVVQCVKGVDAFFLNFLKERGIKSHLIEPYLDRKYCNKIQQLDYFINGKGLGHAKGVLLMDADMFLLNPLNLPALKKFSAKTVDGPNPSLKTLQNIFDHAQMKMPQIVNADWIMEGGRTISTNFNGGFYYIPRKAIKRINKAWKRWSKWLFEHQQLFYHQHERIHIDQVSMALSLTETKTNILKIGANFNYPIHFSLPIRSYDDTMPVQVLHYHNELSPFGTLNHEKVTDPKIRAQIQAANNRILEEFDFVFYVGLKRTQAQAPAIREVDQDFERRLAALKGNLDIELIIHGGTPKTGSTSLQYYLDRNRLSLASKGILYPHVENSRGEPKHQWLIEGLLQSNPEKIFHHFEVIMNEADKKMNSIILSTEGVYNHWFDLAPESKAILKVISKVFKTKLIMFFRDHAAFANSLYKQYILNPPIKGIPCYGKKYSFKQMMEIPWFSRKLDYLAFLLETESIFGRENLLLYPYKGSDTILNFMKYFNLEPDGGDGADHKEKLSLNSATTEMLRILNALNLDPENREKVIDLMLEINTLTQAHSDNMVLTTEESALIRKIAFTQNKILHSSFGLEL